ncbi:polysaccharide deacetylase family protein [Arthrobacter sp. UYEF36]|uniref:polysaccharide deacetylase family protein n=1 Tax=Arthrobacter sp. UYEF36 TaxID=1756366 RepID=UPI003399197F
MTYPPGVQLATLTFSNPSTFLGNEATRTEVTVQSTAGVVWAATGQPIDDFEELVSPAAGMPGSLTVPFVDQAGFTDQAGNVFTMWAYVVTRKTFFGGRSKTVRKSWQPLLGQSEPVDFDNLPGGSVGLPVSAPVVPVTSVAGLTLAVGAEDLATELSPFMPVGVTPEDLELKQDAAALDAATAALIGDPASDAAVVLSATFVPAAKGATTQRLTDTGRGAVVLTMDDGYSAMRTVAGWMNARGQKGTFCITPDLMNDATGVTKIRDADILALAASGHEIAAHSKTHANMTSLSSAQRAVEYDYPKTYLENLLGAGKVTTWTYPFGTGSGGRNLACDQQLYLRYDRWLDTAMTTNSVIYPRYSDAPPMLINRTAWNEKNQQQILTMVRRAASSAIIVPIFFHNLDTVVNPTTANVLEMLDLCQSLGIPLITVSEAFPNPRSLLNAGFEGGLDGVYPAGWHGFTATNGAYSVVTDTPASEYQGTKALELSTTDNTGFAYIRQQVQVVPGRQYTLSGQCKAVSGSNLIADKAFVRIQSLDYGQATIAGLDVKMTPVLAADIGTGWKKFTLDFTAGQSTKTVNVDLGLQATVGGAVIRFDHVWFEPKYLGDLG